MFPLSDSIKTGKIPFVNISLIVFTVFVFLNQLSSPDSFIYSYALIPAEINFSNISTLLPFITSIFLHGGFLHLLFNMWFLWVFGDNVEGHLGHLKYILFYLGAGIAGSMAQYVLAPHSPIPMVGASGAISGVLGAYYVMFPTSKIRTLVPIFGFVSIIELSAPFMLGYWFALQIISGVFSIPSSGSEGGVAFFAHIGGFVAGFLVGKFYTRNALKRID